MSRHNMSELIQFWANGYFIEPLLTITIICVFFISITKRKKHPQFKFFPFYLATFIILQLSSYSNTVFFTNKPFSIN